MKGAVPAEAVAAYIADFSMRALSADPTGLQRRLPTVEESFATVRGALEQLEKRVTKPG